MKRLSSGTIHVATILQAFTDIGHDNIERDRLGIFLRMPEGYPLTQALNNMRTKAYLSTSKVAGRRTSLFTITDKGRKHLNTCIDNVQEYGNYTLRYVDPINYNGSKSLPKAASEPIAATEYSAPLQDAMRELEKVAVYNEHAQRSMLAILNEIERYKMQDFEPIEAYGALALVQKDTELKRNTLLELHQSLIELTKTS